MVQFGFFVLPLVMIISIYYLLGSSERKQTLFKTFSIILLLWISYVLIASQTGVLQSLEMPPRVPLMIILPIFIIIMAATSRSDFKTALANNTLHYPIYVQSFRILVELLIYGAFLEGVFPQRVTFEGLNVDILVGITALPMGYLVQKGLIKSKGILAWNIISLMILSVTAYAFISSFYFTDFVQQNSGEIALVKLPYVLLPGMLLPVAVFYHVVSIRQSLMVR